MSDLRIGVLGSGGRGGIARHAHKPGEGSAVVACCDIKQPVFERMRTWYGEGVFLTTSAQELLAQELDAVFICTPDYLHEEHAVAALEAGLPVYLEKPMAITMAVDREGYMHLSGNMHANHLTYFRSREPADVTTME